MDISPGSVAAPPSLPAPEDDGKHGPAQGRCTALSGGVSAGSTHASARSHRTESPVLTLQQAAAYLQVSRAHLSNLIHGKVPGVPPVRCFRAGRRVLIKMEWIEEWLETKGDEAWQ
jgi:excisionase family DNA binding protein